MRDYSTTEIGMLTGAVIGGLFAVLGFLTTGSLVFLLAAAVGTVGGAFAGKSLERDKKSSPDE